MSNVRAMDPKSKLTWVPKVDRQLPESEQFKIFYHPLDMRKDAEITDRQIESISKGKRSKFKYLVSMSDVKRLELCTVGWEGLIYPDEHELAGQAVPFAVENITLIPSEIRREFIEDITGRKKEAESDDEGDEELGEAETA